MDLYDNTWWKIIKYNQWIFQLSGFENYSETSLEWASCRHLSTMNTFLRNVWNDGQTLIRKPLCSGPLSIADTIFKSKLTLTPRTDLSKAGMPNNRPYKTFLVVHVHTFYFRQCLEFYILLFYFWASLIAFSGPQKLKFAGISSPYSPPWLMHLTKSVMGRDRNTDTITQIFCGICWTNSSLK